jgi:hypothetical protein
LPLVTAVVAVLFGLRQNLPDDVVAEMFGCSQATITRYHEVLHPILRWVTRPEVDEQHARAQAGGALVDGFVAPVGERDDYHGLFSGKKHVSGQNVQVVADLDGRVADVGDPVPRARHDSAAFFISGIAERWAGHYAPGGPGMIGDGGYQGTSLITPTRKPPGGELRDKQKAYNYSVNRLRAAVAGQVHPSLITINGQSTRLNTRGQWKRTGRSVGRLWSRSWARSWLPRLAARAQGLGRDGLLRQLIKRFLEATPERGDGRAPRLRQTRGGRG